MNNLHRKLVLLGKSAVGKTSIASCLRNKDFDEYQETTIGAAYANIELGQYKLDLWDTAGQERYLSLSPMYYRGSNIILLVFDVSNPLTINRIYYYLDKILEDVSTDYQCIIVGSKCDLVNLTEFERIKKIAIFDLSMYNKKLKRPLDFEFISAKDNYNMDELKKKIIKHCENIVVKSQLDIDENGNIIKNNTLKLKTYKWGPDKCSCG